MLSCTHVTDTSFAIKCGGSEVTTSDGTVYEADNSISGTAPTSFYVSRTEKWGVSNVGLFVDKIANTSLVTGTNTPELFKTSRISPGSLRYYGMGLENGPYIVSLQFAEMILKDPSTKTWESTGRRVFDIYIQVKIVHQKSNLLHLAITLIPSYESSIVAVSFNYLYSKKIHLISHHLLCREFFNWETLTYQKRQVVSRKQLKKNSMLLCQKTILKFICSGLVRELAAYLMMVIMDHPFQPSVLFQVTHLNDSYRIHII